MRKGWEYKKLGEICSSDLGKTLNKSKDVGNMRPYLCAINILWDSIDLTTLKEACFKDDEIDRYTVKYGDLLVCEGGDTGRAAIWDRKEPILYQNALHRLRFKEDVDARFIMYNLWHKKQIGEIDHKYSKGVTILHLVKSALLSIPILLPPLSTQLAIVSELDKINELIRLKKEQLKDFDNLAQSLFYEMFGDPVENEKGWEVKKLGEIGEFKNGLNFSKDENGHSIKFLGVSDFQNKKSIASDQLAYISLSERVQEDYLLKTGDIVFVRSNGKKELIGRSVKMYITEPTTYSGFCIRCRITDEKVDKDYIAILLKTPIIRQFMTNSGRGCNISNLNQKVLNSIPTILPPLSLQRLFAQRIEQIEREKSEVQKSIQDLETLQASRMQYWFE